LAQLSSDSFAFGGALLRLDDALDDLEARLEPVTTIERVGLASLPGRVLAGDILAPINVPGFDNSAVDGYAVRYADLAPAAETRLPVLGRIAAGALDVAPLVGGTASRIFTGAPMPAGADTVFMQEDVRIENAEVVLPSGLMAGANRRLAGEDFGVGSVVVPAGTRLAPHHIAALAALGIGAASVRARLTVGVFSTGDEVVDCAAGPLRHGAQFDSNRPMLMALLAARGMEAVDLGILPDRGDAIAEALARGAETCDALLTSGGVSTGDEDHVKAAVEAAGRLDFWRLAIKPGRPVAMGTILGRSFFGMPGNPAAVFVTFTRFVGPVLDRLAGGRANRPLPLPVIAGFSYGKKAERREYVRVRLAAGAEGAIAHRYPRDGAALISSLVQSDGFVELEEDRLTVTPGERLAYLPFAALIG
jgi:molybdopterin molybdotransferase